MKRFLDFLVFFTVAAFVLLLLLATAPGVHSQTMQPRTLSLLKDPVPEFHSLITCEEAQRNLDINCPQLLPMSRTFSSRIGGDWLRVERFNLKDDPDGFHPCYTQIRCAYMPVVKKVDGVWVIQFVSEIAARLP